MNILITDHGLTDSALSGSPATIITFFADLQMGII